jgi:hypothetical protein
LRIKIVNGIREQAHKMRGSSGHLGENLFAKIAFKIEHLEESENDSILSFSHQIIQLKAEFTQLEIAVKEWLKTQLE